MADPFIDSALDDDPDSDLYTASLTRSGGKVVTVTWTDNTSGNLFKTVDITRSGGLVTTVLIKVYDTLGLTIKGQKTLTYNRTGNLVTTITSTRNV